MNGLRRRENDVPPKSFDKCLDCCDAMPRTWREQDIVEELTVSLDSADLKSGPTCTINAKYNRDARVPQVSELAHVVIRVVRRPRVNNWQVIHIVI